MSAATRFGLPARGWLGLSHLMRRWHRYEVTGLEHLPTHGSALIVGYHGRPMALDLVLLQSLIHDRLGYVPHAFAHAGLFKVPVLGRMFSELGMVAGDGPHLDAAVARGEHLIVTPGGTREGLRSHRDTYRVDWGHRRGYLKLALRLGLPIVPVGGSGMDHIWHGLFDGNAFAKGLPKFVPEPLRIPVWLGVGPLGLAPLSPPWPVKIHQAIGPAIHLQADGPVDPRDRAALDALHQRVAGAVQDQIDAARNGQLAPGVRS